MAWPPDLAALKDDLGEEYVTSDRDDTRLQRCLDAAVAFVERVHDGEFDFDAESASASESSPALDPPDDDMELGTIRLAGRWYIRRRSPDGLVDMGQMGSGRVPSFDPDIDRMLRIGKYVPVRFA